MHSKERLSDILRIAGPEYNPRLKNFYPDMKEFAMSGNNYGVIELVESFAEWRARINGEDKSSAESAVKIKMDFICTAIDLFDQDGIDLRHINNEEYEQRAMGIAYLVSEFTKGPLQMFYRICIGYNPKIISMNIQGDKSNIYTIGLKGIKPYTHLTKN